MVQFRKGGLYIIIDWSWIYIAPLPAMLNHSWFIADVPGRNNAGVSTRETFSEDRLYLGAAIERQERLLDILKQSRCY